MEEERNESVTETAEAPGDNANYIPRTRFNDVNKRMKVAETRVAELEAQLVEMEQLRSQHGALSADLRLADLGIRDAEGRDLARYLHSKQGEGAPSLEDWMAQQLQDVSAAHPALRSYLPSPAPPPPSASSGTEPPPGVVPAQPPLSPVLPTAGAGARPSAASPPDVTSQQLAEARVAYNQRPSAETRETLARLAAQMQEQIRRDAGS